MQQLNVNYVLISKQGVDSKNYQIFRNIVKEKNITVGIVGKGDRIKIEKDLYLDVLWPDNLNLINENVLNNNSIVCKLNYGNFSILFTGDIEEISENQILREYKANLKILNSTILKVGHHGSKTSSTINFIQTVNPKIALIGVGKGNKFGHPNNDVLSRFKDLSVQVYRTDINGEISIVVDKNGSIKSRKLIDDS